MELSNYCQACGCKFQHTGALNNKELCVCVLYIVCINLYRTYATEYELPCEVCVHDWQADWVDLTFLLHVNPYNFNLKKKMQ